MHEAVGYTAAFLTIFMQLQALYDTACSKGRLHPPVHCTGGLFATCALWVAYGAYKSDAPIILAASLSMSEQLFMIFLTILDRFYGEVDYEVSRQERKGAPVPTVEIVASDGAEAEKHAKKAEGGCD